MIEEEKKVEETRETKTDANTVLAVSCRHEWKYNRTICVKVCVKCNYAENYSS